MDLSTLPHELPALASIALLLGVRHGFDADHLAAIDGLTRTCSRHQPRLARSVGALFSLGHGSVVLAVALLVSHMQAASSVPAWLEWTGAWVSILTLFGLALVNGLMLWQTRSSDMEMKPRGWRSMVFARLMSAQRPGSIALVGALFALSFDTVSQASLFAIAASKYGGAQPAMGLALVFTVGMLLTDGFNGAVVAKLVTSADVSSRTASRSMGYAVVIASALTGAIGLSGLLFAPMEDWVGANGWLLSMAVITCVTLGFALGMIVRRPSVRQQHADI